MKSCIAGSPICRRLNGGSEAYWLGPSTDTTDGQKVLWRRNGTTSIERNVEFCESSSIEGEIDMEGFLSNADESRQSPTVIQSSPNAKTSPTIAQSIASPSGPSSNLQQPPNANQLPETAPVIQTDVLNFIQGIDSEADEEESEEQRPRRTGRQRKPSAWVRRVEAGESVDPLPRGAQIHQSGKAAVGFDVPVHVAYAKAAMASPGTIPKSLEEAQSSENWPKWKEAMKAQ